MSMELGIYHNNFSHENNTYDQAIKIDNSDSLAVMGGNFIQTKLDTRTNKSKYDDNKNGNKNSIIPCTLSIDNYIAKLINLAKLDTRIERLAIDLAHKTLNNLLADGKSPNGLAAAYIYLSAVLLGMNILQIDVSGLAGVTEVTIRNRCKDILCSSRIIITIKPHIR
jgi:transcription initiation factor TFIIB